MAHPALSSYIHGCLGHRHGMHELGEYLSGSSYVRIFGCLIALIAYLAYGSSRIFLGLAEGGLLPGLIYIISLWYPRQMQAKRICILAVAKCFGAAFGGILAHVIQCLDG